MAELPRVGSKRSIATRTGDDGTTGLLYGQRLAKSHPQIEAVGTVDELNAVLGLAKAQTEVTSKRDTLESIQQELVALMGELACTDEDASRYLSSTLASITDQSLAHLATVVATIEAHHQSFSGWATPGNTPLAATLDFARTVTRRAERRVSALPEHGRHPRPLVLHYLNRLSDLLWLMAREAEAPVLPPA